MRVSKMSLAFATAILMSAIFFKVPHLLAADSKPKDKTSAKALADASETSAKNTALDTIIEKIVRREQNEVTSFELFSPVIETYIQQLKPDREMGAIPYTDSYFIGQADLSNGIHVHSMLPKHGLFSSALSFFSNAGAWNWGGFVQMIYPDRYELDRNHYEFKYSGEDFLGAVRCLTFDLTPKPHSGKGRFKGRIWVEDRDYTIVRFNGTFVGVNSPFGSPDTVHFDSWRMNVQPDLWLPAYVYIEGVNKKPGRLPTFKAQTHFWGYSPKIATGESEFSNLYIDSNQRVQDDSTHSEDASPVQEQRRFDRDAEENVLDTLVHDGLIAPEGPVDKVLDTVLNNLEVTNHLDIEPELRCRVMLTSNIELFSVGHTIVLSRGLLDVLPDESTLAVMLAQELSDALVWKPSTSEYGFYDVLQTPSPKAMKNFSFHENREALASQSARTLLILRNSPYRSNLGTAALFFQELSTESKLIPHLIGPNLGNRIYPLAALMNSGPMLQPNKVDQIAALPMNSRIKLNPWSDDIQFLKTTPVPLLSAREKMPFEITPFLPFLARYAEVRGANVAPNADAAANENTR